MRIHFPGIKWAFACSMWCRVPANLSSCFQVPTVVVTADEKSRGIQKGSLRPRSALSCLTAGHALSPSFRPDDRHYFSAVSLGLFFPVSDASGRYSSQFHFGNGFWLGSSTLCRELNVTHEKSARGIDDDDDEAEGEEEEDRRPPFPLRFHVARLYLMLPKEVDFSVSLETIFPGKVIVLAQRHSSPSTWTLWVPRTHTCICRLSSVCTANAYMHGKKSVRVTEFPVAC